MEHRAVVADRSRCLHRFMQYTRPKETRRYPRKRTAAVAIWYVMTVSWRIRGSPMLSADAKFVCWTTRRSIRATVDVSCRTPDGKGQHS